MPQIFENLQKILESYNSLFAPNEPIQLIQEKILFTDTPLHFAANSGELSRVFTLIYNGANIDAEGDMNLTPIYNAIRSGNAEVVRAFIGLGACLDKENRLGTSPLDYALAIKSKTEIIELLANPNFVNKLVIDFNEYTPQYRSADAKNLAQVLNACTSNYLYLKQKISIECKTLNTKSTPLQLMSSWGDLNVVNILIKNKAKLNAKDRQGNTALFYAVLGQNHEVLDWLIEAGVDTKLINNKKMNLLEFMFSVYSNESIIKKFLSSFINHNIKFAKPINYNILFNPNKNSTSTLNSLNKIIQK